MSDKKKRICKCQDSNSEECNMPMSNEEFEQDGFCSYCADNVWEEMKSPIDNEYQWYHKDNPKRKTSPST